ncbi:polysaccharide pyruvyl transferase family protein [Candidatus Woesearchaeota archaeon]|nr:polysaccharide pyruvyl transferase family protein [Candidatus Woesearchaeota archaeon]USN44161.1 MAG: polysaccharide pyruvyl transferase family protein [Candidatus Woesearchaeota archaeon]
MGQDKKKTCILGWAGNGNHGDEVLTLALIQKLLRSGVRKEDIVVFSRNPQETEACFSVKSVYIKDFFRCYREVMSSKLLIFGGGGLIHDQKTMKDSLFWYSFLFAAFLARTKCLVFGQTIGPLKNRRDRRLAQFFLSRVQAITVRDEYSFKEVQSLGLKTPLYLTGDLVLNMALEESENVFSEEEKKFLAKPYIVISLKDISKEKWNVSKDYDQDADIEKIAFLVDQLCSVYKENIILFPFQTTGNINDIEFNSKIYEKLKQKKRVFNWKNLRVKAETILSGSQVIIGVRLHCLILSAVLGKAFFTLSYNEKTTGFSEQFSLLKDYILDFKTLDIRKFLEVFGQFYEQKNSIQKGLKKEVLVLQEKERMNDLVLRGMYGR